MPLRLATPADEPILGSLCAAAFFNESLFGATIHPYRNQYPDDVALFWRNWARTDLRDPRKKVIVSTTTIDDQEKILGVATWQRQGDDEGAQKVMSEWKDPGPDAFEEIDLSANRAKDPAKEGILAAAFPYFKHFWDGEKHGLPRSQNWYLHHCAVSPKYQNQGIGKQLVAWGLKLAKEENVHASVLASEGNEGFYLKCGFDEIVGNSVEAGGEANPLMKEGVKGGDCLFMWAKEKTGEGA
ncbi:hypothetical protein EK21DRAFT_97647 [Setomelanomma holmii]|uniref:N-acetyltransferase domain-containing protein n=1 Tax=Setomelanomma holmii TaxID=210430 RepID=A0A9P4LRX0_9PLEO|nr:hypothetical protein EK21DRAFT_97647 [Setomelanomma holmii]